MSENKTHLEAEFPHLGWSDVHAVPQELIGATILFIGSEKDTAELVIDYQITSGEQKRIVLGFTERGMWLQSSVGLPVLTEAL